MLAERTRRYPAAERLLGSLTLFRKRSRSTLYQYRLVAEAFLGAHGEQADQEAIMAFLGTKRAPATKAFAYTIIRRLYVVNNWPWPLPPGVAPEVRREEQHQVRLDDAAVGKLVGALRQLKLPERSYLALATVYGCRREELAGLTRSALDGERLTFQAVKHGRLRRHQVPEALLPHLRWLPMEPREVKDLDQAFHRMLDIANVTLPVGSGWHAIRRSLISRLERQVPEVTLGWFMGWKTNRAAYRMISVYAEPNDDELRAVDNEVYAKHPYLGMWK